LLFDTNRHYLISGNHSDGVLAIWDLDKPGKEKYAHNIASLQGKEKVRYAVWSSGRAELMSGNGDGTVTFWNAKKATPIYVIPAHTDAITKLQWFESSSMLVTAGKDKKIKFYQLPAEWKDPRLEEALQAEARLDQQAKAMQKSQDNIKKGQADSDDDDLGNWHK